MNTQKNYSKICLQTKHNSYINFQRQYNYNRTKNKAKKKNITCEPDKNDLIQLKENSNNNKCLISESAFFDIHSSIKKYDYLKKIFQHQKSLIWVLNLQTINII